MILRPVAPAGAEVQPSAVAETMSFVERRFARRKAAATNALILSPDINVPISCLVRDVSTTGARIELVVSPENLLGGRAKLPGSFTLNLRLDRMEVDCVIVWRNGPFVGVRFVATPRSYSRGPR
jgi:hypothetical protein